MKLRKLKVYDAPYMLEWMHDIDITKDLATNFENYTLNDCVKFIKKNQIKSKDLHLAIVDERNTYMGTVSLKNISSVYLSAEFAITIRREALGKGYSQFAMQKLINIAFNKLYLNKIYWCVSKNNERAIRFYEKMGYKETSFEDIIISCEFSDKIKTFQLKWYSVNAFELNKNELLI